MTIEHDMNVDIRLRDKPYCLDNAEYLVHILFGKIAQLDKIVQGLPKADSNGFIDYVPQSDRYAQKNDLIRQLSGYRDILIKYQHAAECAMKDIQKRTERIKKDQQLLNSSAVKNKYIETSECFCHEYIKHKETRDRICYVMNYMERSIDDGTKRKYPKKRPTDPEFQKLNVNTIFQKEAHGNGKTQFI